MAEKIRPTHLPPTTVPSQQTLLVASAPSDAVQHMMQLPKLQQVPSQQPHNSTQPDIALHARPASSSVPGTEHNTHATLSMIMYSGLCSLKFKSAINFRFTEWLCVIFCMYLIFGLCY